MSNLEKLLKKYDYSFPKLAIALRPASPRDSAKLVIYDRETNKTQYDTFANIAKYLSPRSVLVFNDTKVIPARLGLRKTTGGKVELLILEQKKDLIRALSPVKLKLSEGLNYGRNSVLNVREIKNGEYLLELTCGRKMFAAILEKAGETPLPPYLKNSPLKESERRAWYQSIFAKHGGSVAAPTASLHFTKRLISKLRRAGHDVVSITLHVGLGTFAPVTDAHMTSGMLHAEHFEITREVVRKLNAWKAEGRPIVAVGTTAVRTLESAARGGKLKKLRGDTRLFIREGYKFQFVDAIITNFHVPRSSLLMLVSAFAGRKNILALYRKAIVRGFKLFSFGDGMLIK